MCRLSPVRRNLSGTSGSVNMSILWKNPAAASRDGILRSWGCLGYLIQLASLARESAFVKKLQISTTFERSGRPARRRLTFIGSQNPNQTKKHLFRCLFCLAGGNTLDFSAHLPSIVREGAFVGEPQVPTTFERSGRPAAAVGGAVCGRRPRGVCGGTVGSYHI